MKRYVSVTKYQSNDSKPQRVNTTWRKYEIDSNYETKAEREARVEFLTNVIIFPFKVGWWLFNKIDKKLMENPEYVARLKYDEEQRQLKAREEQQRILSEKLKKQKEFDDRVEAELQKLRNSKK